MKKADKWKGICIHHSLTKDNETLSWNAITKYHIEKNKWDDVGYHFGIELVDDEVITLPGRDLRYRGAHCPALNSTHIGICVVGNYDVVEPSAAHIEKLVSTCVGLCKIFDIDPDDIEYHCDFSNKTCPGKLFIDIEVLRELVRSELYV